MTEFEFMGKRVELEEEIRYFPPFDYWVKLEEDQNLLTFGLTPTGNIKEGQYRSVEFTVSEGDEISCGDVIALAITGKLKYLDSMAAGKITDINRDLEKDINFLKGNLYNGWLVSLVSPEAGQVYDNMVELSDYQEILKRIEQGAPPPGVKGGTSPTCRSVYQAIKEQKEK